MRKTPEEEINFKKKNTKMHFSANQPPGFSTNGTSSSNGLFQITNGLKRLAGYSKRLHKLLHGALFYGALFQNRKS